MSEKNAKEERKFKVIAGEADNKKIADDMAESIRKMYEDRDKKALAAKEHLVSQLAVTSDKYRTANGVMSALDTVRTVFGEDMLGIDEELNIAKHIAKHMAAMSMDMADAAKKLCPDDMDKLCDGFYDKEFSGAAIDLAYELMALQLCQNVGPSAQDVTDFCRTADTEIEKARENLRTFCSENGLDFNEVCGIKPADILCDSCVKGCRDASKIICPGESAYDICHDFTEAEFE